MRRALLSVFALAFVIMVTAPVHGQDFNPKSVESMTLDIVQSGQLAVSGDLQKANLTLYVPQEGIRSIDVSSNSEMSWHYSNDRFGNRVVVMEWSNPSGTMTYRIETVVDSSAKFVNPTADIGFAPTYLNFTKSIVINDDIRRLAYPYDRTWNNVAFLTKYVYDTVKYDISLVGAREPSDWVLQNKRGVCVEHANLLTSLLRASGIPTRYVVGYAYSTVDKKLIGHTWIEVLASDGMWVPFDPTWLEGGYLDATHIKTANLLDDSQVDMLTYEGPGKITWTRGNGSTGELYYDTVSVLSYTPRNITAIDLSSSTVAAGGYSYVRATVTPSACLINQITAQSCVDRNGNSVFDFYEPTREFFSCASSDVYWFFRNTDRKDNFLCPVTVYDQIGSAATTDVRTAPAVGGGIAISGPGTAGANEKFRLSVNANSDFIFYSPEFGKSMTSTWDLQIKRPGTYNFYAYKGGNLDIKSVTVVSQKEFDLSIQVPGSVAMGGSFIANVTVKNLDGQKTAVLAVNFDGSHTEKQLSFAAGETKNLFFNITATSAGEKQVSAQVQANALSAYSASIKISQPSTTLIDKILEFVKSVLTVIKNFFESIFGKKA